LPIGSILSNATLVSIDTKGIVGNTFGFAVTIDATSAERTVVGVKHRVAALAEGGIVDTAGLIINTLSCDGGNSDREKDNELGEHDEDVVLRRLIMTRKKMTTLFLIYKDLRGLI